MNSSLRTANLFTHVKIVAVALLAVIAVVLIGTKAQVKDSTETALVAQNRIVVKAARPTTVTMQDTATIR
jgi:hypothetical protein